MKELKKEVTKEQIVQDARNEGRQDVLEYIRFVIKRYPFKMNFGGIL